MLHFGWERAVTALFICAAETFNDKKRMTSRCPPHMGDLLLGTGDGRGGMNQTGGIAHA